MRSRYEQFSIVISTIYRSMQKIERDEMEKYGYKGSYAQYFTVLSGHPEGLTAGQLCELCDKDKAAISRAMGDMEEKGLVTRVSEGDSKYRAKLFLTPEGKRLAEVVGDRARMAVCHAGVDLSEEDRQAFYLTLEKVAANLHVINKEGIPADVRQKDF